MDPSDAPVTEAVDPQVLAEMPLLQQSTRPFAWRQWFDALGLDAPQALAGPRYELFSMTAAAAIHGLGVALVPHLLVETELARGDLVLACDQSPSAVSAYYWVTPMRVPAPPALMLFQNWLLQTIGR